MTTQKSGSHDMSAETRVILNTIYREISVSKEEIEQKIKKEMKQNGIKEVIHVDADGKIKRYKNS